MKDTYLVTGGAGFVGNHITRRLVHLGHEVRVIDNLITGHKKNLDDVLDQIDFWEQDITDLDVVSAAMAGVDYVLHQAALPSVPRSVEDPITTDWNNSRGTLNILVAAQKAGVKRVVQACSSSAYGDTPTMPKVETMQRSPLSPYACSKAVGELYGCAFYRTYGMEYVGLRYFNVFGARQDPKSQYAAVIPKFITCFMKGESPVVYGDGRQTRDFSYIDNVVQANLLACAAKGASGRIFNIACGERIDLLTVLDVLSEVFGKSVEPEFEPARPSDIKHSLADISLAKKHLGYEPQVKFAEGIQKTISWYQKHGDRY